MTQSDLWGPDVAQRYDTACADMFADDVLGPTVDRIVELAAGGPVLEFAIGTGRVGCAVADRGLPVSGIEYSQAMIDVLRQKRSELELPVVCGDMATTTVAGAGDFAVVFLVFNSLSNLLTQEAQVACFRNAAHHLRPGGHFLIDLWVPPVGRVPEDSNGTLMKDTQDHIIIDDYDVVTQRGASRHFSRAQDGAWRYAHSPYRYAWPTECDLMAQLAGMSLVSRHADWRGATFTKYSPSHVSVWRKGTESTF